MWQTVRERVISNPDLTSHLCVLNTIPDFRDIMWILSHLHACGRCICPDFRTWLAQANSLILPEACQDSEMSKTRWLERVGHGPACAHGDTACFRILTESGIMLWRQSSLAESKCPLSGEFFYAFVRFVLFWISIKFGQSSLVKVFSFLELINHTIPHIRDKPRF